MGLCEDGDFQSYWAKTGSFEGVKDYIKLNFEGLREDIISLILFPRFNCIVSK